MASKGKKSAKNGGKTAAKKPAAAKQVSAKQATAKTKGTRQMPDKKLVESLSKEMDLTLKRTGDLTGTFGNSMRDAKARGVDLQAFRLAKRFHRKAKDDALAGAILWENFQYILLECLEFEKMIAPSMFPASETRSGKASSTKKKNGHEDDDKQTTLAMPPQELPPPEGGERDADAPVH